MNTTVSDLPPRGETIHQRIARTLDWSLCMVQQMSLATLFDLVRPVDAVLAHDIAVACGALRAIGKPSRTRNATGTTQTLESSRPPDYVIAAAEQIKARAQ